MKRNWKSFLSGCLTTLAVVGLVGTAAATVGKQTVTVDYNDIKVTLNGEQVALVNANGSPVEPFAINGTTYLPIRAVATALGLDVSWDSTTNTAVLSTPSVDTKPDSGSSLTTGQKNALEQAKSYLSVMPFSRSGLIDQLEYEGYSTEDATFAVDNCGANWNEQAALKAQSYLDLMSFSRSRLIEQLEYEGFTSEQAEYGATAVGY